MKKVKQSKKRWARTEAQGRRDYHNNWWNRRRHVPTDFVQAFIDLNETLIKKAMHDLNAGVDPDEVFIKTRYRPKCSAAWWWL